MPAPQKTVSQHLADAQEIIRKKNTEINSLNKRLKAIKEINDTAEKVRQVIYGIAARDPRPPAWVNGKGGTSGTRGMPCTIWSDWHWGEVVNAREVGGVNEFDRDVARKRVTKLVNTTVDLAFNHMGRAKTNYPGVVVMLGGDMVGGSMHEELMRTNAGTDLENIEEVVDVLAAALDEMASKFGNVWVPCVVGNHGRTTRKVAFKQHITTNLDWNLYCSLKRHFRNEKRINFLIPQETDAFFEILGHRYLLTHGDMLGVKGGDGIIGALGPIMRGSLKTARSEAQINREFDTLVLGHWHQYLTLPGLIVNNSLKGYDEFARLALRAPYSRPSQALWFSHPDHGITAHWQVYLEKLRLATDNTKLVSWAA